ncbi:unknown [Prevotella sp. CAG:873]|nr:unknown [Prevotella sp. CAG:873]
MIWGAVQSAASAVLDLTSSAVAPDEVIVTEVPLATSPGVTLNVGVAGASMGASMTVYAASAASLSPILLWPTMLNVMFSLMITSWVLAVMVCVVQSAAYAVLDFRVSDVAPFDLMVTDVPLATSPGVTLNVGVSGAVSTAPPSS